MRFGFIVMILRDFVSRIDYRERESSTTAAENTTSLLGAS